MAASTILSLTGALREGGLLPPEQLDELPRLQAQFPDSRALAQELLRRNWLTPFQVNQLLLGKGQTLRLGPYRLLQRLGEGGGGQVFRAEHSVMRRPVALKLLRPELLTDAETLRRFEREIQFVAGIAHPNVVQAHDAGQVGATYFLAMEYIPGQDLHQLVKQRGPLPVAQACEYIRQAALALQHIHEHGLVHRDVKPSNLILCQPPTATAATPDPDRTAAIVPAPTALPVAHWGVVKLLDLGLARLLHPHTDARARTLTADQSLTMGTLDYLSPEQAVDFHNVDIRADVYSLGCTFYFLLTGLPPFTEGTTAQILLKHQSAEPTPVRQLRSDVPPDVAALVGKMLAKRPEDRFQTPGEIAALLPAPVAIPLADSTFTGRSLRGWTARLRGYSSRLGPRHWLPALRRLSWKTWAGVAGSLVLLLALWQVWAWWATPTFRISARDGSGATTYGDRGAEHTPQAKAPAILVREQGPTLRGMVRFDLSVLHGRRNIGDAVLELTLANARPEARTIQVFGLPDKHGWELWEPARQTWHGFPMQMHEPNHGVLLGAIHVGRELAQKGGATVTLSNAALVEFLRKDTNDVVTFGFLSPEPNPTPLEIAGRQHPNLPSPALRITLR